MLLRQVTIPGQLLATSRYGDFGGDVRVGDLTGNGQIDFLVYRTVDGVKPCFIGAFDLAGRVLWQKGSGGGQPARPGPVAVFDIDGDGDSEVVCFFHDPDASSSPNSLKDVLVQILDGRTGQIENSVHPSMLDSIQGEGPNWVHQRILAANLHGDESPRCFVVKLGTSVTAFDCELRILWTYENPWHEYTRCPAYIPCVGDIDADGKDEVNGGYFLLDDDGTVLWEEQLGRNMDSVAIAPWDNGVQRAFCSGFGHVVDVDGNVILELGEDVVPHGQELRVAHFDPAVPGPQMMIRHKGHTPDVILVDRQGSIIREFRLNESPNNTGMEAIYWHGPDQPALLYNGGVLWRGNGERFSDLAELPKAKGDSRQGWYHCVPVDLLDNSGEEIIVYNPWDANVFLFARANSEVVAFKEFTPGPRQYNVRLMD